MRVAKFVVGILFIILAPVRLMGYYDLSGAEQKEIRSVLEETSEKAYKFIGLKPPHPPKVILVDDWQEVTEKGISTPPEWGAAIALPYKNMIILKKRSFSIVAPDLQRILTHEFIHIAVYHRVNGVPLPGWFDEGVAQIGSGETRFLSRAMLALAAWRKKVYSLRNLEYRGNFSKLGPSFSYAASLSALELLSEKYGIDIVRDIIDSTNGQDDFRRGFKSATGISLNQFYQMWEDYIRKKYRFFFLTSSNQIIWTVAALAFMLIAIWKWISKKRKIKRMKDEEGSTYNGVYYTEPPFDSS